MRYIGDVHGKIGDYIRVIADCDHSIQVGDMGAGFVELANPGPNHRFIRGNHDNPIVCQQSTNWIPDYTVEGSTFYMGGAFSIDWYLRTEGLNWWAAEQLSENELSVAIDIYSTAKPDIVITHDAPSKIACEKLFGVREIRNRTATALQMMWEIHRPRVWIHGHWHIDIRKTVDDCEFICLDELSFVDL